MILVTGATGNVGRHAVDVLRDAQVDVRALTRQPAAANLPPDVDVVAGDLADPTSLDTALDGVESVFLIWPTLMADHAAPETVATIAEHVDRIVYLSARGVGDAPEAGPGTVLGSHAFLEGLIRAARVEWTFLRPGGFATNTLMWAPQIRDGDVVRWCYGAAARPLIHERDIAAAAVAALTSAGHAAATYVLTGPRVLTQVEQVHTIGEALGRPLRWEDLAPTTVRDQLLAQGWPMSLVDGILNASAVLATTPETTTDTVEQLTAVPASTFHQWATDHAHEFARPAPPPIR